MLTKSLAKSLFDKLAIEGFIGDPHGQLAYAYIRISTDISAAMLRQIQHIHEVASSYEFKISWDFFYWDYASGFEFESRPGLTGLRNEYKSAHSRAFVVVLDDVNRLSRNGEFVGFLLDEMVEYEVKPFFW